jgi:hypothetical protein
MKLFILHGISIRKQIFSLSHSVNLRTHFLKWCTVLIYLCLTELMAMCPQNYITDTHYNLKDMLWSINYSYKDLLHTLKDLSSFQNPPDFIVPTFCCTIKQLFNPIRGITVCLMCYHQIICSTQIYSEISDQLLQMDKSFNTYIKKTAHNTFSCVMITLCIKRTQCPPGGKKNRPTAMFRHVNVISTRAHQKYLYCTLQCLVWGLKAKIPSTNMTNVN